ncbi:hypothetical protein INR49_025438, partial [Caranx melampygus]
SGDKATAPCSTTVSTLRSLCTAAQASFRSSEDTLDRTSSEPTSRETGFLKLRLKRVLYLEMAPLDVMKRCQCVSTIPSINPRLISGVKVYVSRPYCKNMEVIVRLNDSSSTCLDTKTQFTKDLLKAVEMKKAAQAAQQKQQQTQTQ